MKALRFSLNKSHLAGLDFMEFDVLTAGSIVSGRKDPTYRIMAEAYRRLTESQI